MAKADGDVRMRIVAEARRLFARGGYHGTSVDSIVRAAGVSKGAFYWHFQDKFSLYREIVFAMEEDVKRHFSPSEESLPRDSEAFILERGEEFIELCWKDPDRKRLWMHMLVEANSDNEEILALAREVPESIFGYFAQRFAEAFPKLTEKEKEFDHRDLIQAVAMCLDGILVNMSIHGDCARAKRTWAFCLRRLLEGGPSYAS